MSSLCLELIAGLQVGCSRTFKATRAPNMCPNTV